jgi:hypothetical protein
MALQGNTIEAREKSEKTTHTIRSDSSSVMVLYSLLTAVFLENL